MDESHARLLAIAELDLSAAPQPAAQEDPFATSTPSGERRADATSSAERRLAQRDPDAPPDVSAEYRMTGAASFDELLRAARLKAFLAGAAAGAVGAAVVAAVLALALSRPGGTATVAFVAPAPTPAEPPQAASRGGEPEAAAAPEPSAPVGRVSVARGARVHLGLNLAQAGGAGKSPATAASASEPAAAAAAGTVAGTAPALAAVPASAAAPASAPASAAAPAAAPAAALAPAQEPTAGPSAPARARGPFPESAVAEALRARSAAVAECVAATAGDASAARGQPFALTVVIAPSGRVSDAEIDDPDVEATPLGICLVRLARTMSFPSFEGEPFRVELALAYGDSE